jgi:putative peptidoglycan lipid II flippase
MRLTFTRSIDWFGIRELIHTAFPRIATLGLIQISQLYLVSIATTLAIGSVSVFTFAFNIQMVPLSLIGVSYSVAAFPVLVQMYQKKDIHALWGNVISAMRHIIFWSIPVVCFAVVLRAHIVRVLYGSGEFTWTDTRLTAAVFALMIISLAAQGLSLLFMRTLYAMKYSYMPLIGQLASLLTTLLVSYFGFWLWNTSEIFRFFLEALFRVEGIPGTSIMIVGIAYALSSIILTMFLWVTIHKAIPFAKSLVCRRVFIQSLGASLVGATVCYAALVYFSPLISLDTFWGVSTHALLGALFGGVAWFGILYILGSIELREFVHALKKRFWNTDIVQGELQEL